MHSSADQPEPQSVHPDSEGTPNAGQNAEAVAGEGYSGEADKAKQASESKMDPAKLDSEPVKAEAADIATGSEASSSSGQAATEELANNEPARRDVAKRAEPEVKAPGSALISVVPAAERFETHQEAPDYRVPPRRAKKKNRLFVYSSRAALIVFLLGGAYVAGGTLFHNAAPGKPEQVAQIAPAQPAQKPAAPSAAAPSPTATAAAAAESVDRAEFRRVTHEMSEEIRSLKSSLEGLRNSVAQAQNGDEARGLKKGLDGVKSGLEASKTETNNAIAQLTSKIDHMQREQTAKLQQMLERIERAEKASASMTTGSIPAAASTVTANAAPTAKSASQIPLPPASINTSEAQKKSPQSVPNWVVRDVYDGIALVEGPNGAFEVMQGETIPGLGTVKSIERRGNGWTVVTNRGNVEYARE